MPTKIPEYLLNSLAGLPGFDKAAFEDVHERQESITSIRINPAKPLPAVEGLPIPWSQYGYYLPERPSFTFDPLFHAGCYYVQEASSMFLEEVFRQHGLPDQPIKVLDLSAAPGGKSTHIQSLIGAGGYLVSNDVIRSRATILRDNIIKWGSVNVMVTNNDPADFAKLDGFFDVLVVDAPCSGSGLFRRDPEAIDEWSLNNVQLCSQRQQRILADAWPCLKKGGLLIYSTCSYSKEEDEDIIDWIGMNLNAVNSPLQLNADWGITETNTKHGTGYRFWPHQVKGEGFFLTCFRKLDGNESSSMRIKKQPDKLGQKERVILKPWVREDGLEFIRKSETIYAWPLNFVQEWSYLLQEMRVIYSGTLVGERVRDKLIPDHALAMSPLISEAVKFSNTDKENAIRFLQRKDMEMVTDDKGWQLVKYGGFPLGWVNVLSNRMNNYYPKEFRILKDK